jgi:hypothetical protein
MPQGHSDQVFPVFIVVWVALGLFSAGFFFLNKNAPLKRKVWPPFTIAAALLFIGFIVAMDAPAPALLFAVPGVVLITWIDLRVVRFCNSCGATIMRQKPFATPKFCSRCGAALAP